MAHEFSLQFYNVKTWKKTTYTSQIQANSSKYFSELLGTTHMKQ